MAKVPDMRFIRFSDLKAFGIVSNRMTLKRWLERKNNPFPKPHQFGENLIAWRVSEVEAWLKRTKRGEHE